MAPKKKCWPAGPSRCCLWCIYHIISCDSTFIVVQRCCAEKGCRLRENKHVNRLNEGNRVEVYSALLAITAAAVGVDRVLQTLTLLSCPAVPCPVRSYLTKWFRLLAVWTPRSVRNARRKSAKGVLPSGDGHPLDPTRTGPTPDPGLALAGAAGAIGERAGIGMPQIFPQMLLLARCCLDSFFFAPLL